MKKPTYSFSLLTMIILLAWLTLAVTGTANAKWLCIHGHSGQIQDESALEKIGRRRWGLGRWTQSVGQPEGQNKL